MVDHVEDHFEVVSVNGEVVGDGALGQLTGSERPHRQAQRLVVHHRLQTHAPCTNHRNSTAHSNQRTIDVKIKTNHEEIKSLS